MPDPALDALITDAKTGHVETTEVVAAFKETKAGYKTTEFWASAAGLAALNLNGLVLTLPDKWQAIGSVVIVGLYAISRGLAKNGVPAASD